jgi:hypothetical protein
MRIPDGAFFPELRLVAVRLAMRILKLSFIFWHAVMRCFVDFWARLNRARRSGRDHLVAGPDGRICESTKMS